jgi:hypothetical protein
VNGRKEEKLIYRRKRMHNQEQAVQSNIQERGNE